MDSRSLVSKLTDLRQTQRFTNADFKERGLNPSDRRTTASMVNGLNQCLDELMKSALTATEPAALKDTLIKGLNRMKADDYDTEEREFIADEFAVIEEALGVDIGDEVNAWFYGEEMAAMLKAGAEAQKLSHNTKSHPDVCANCQQPIVLNVSRERAGVPPQYFLGTCKNCNSLHILETPANAGQINFENFLGIKSFNTREEAQKQKELKTSGKK